MSSDDGQPIPLLDGEPAFLLDEGIAYVRGWGAAQRSVAQLRDALAEIGHEDFLPYLRADVNVFGAGIVELGRVTPETADLIAQALRLMPAHHDKVRDGHVA